MTHSRRLAKSLPTVAHDTSKLQAELCHPDQLRTGLYKPVHSVPENGVERVTQRKELTIAS